MKKVRNIIKEILAWLAICSLYTRLQEKRRDKNYGRYIRMVSYHATPAASARKLERQFRFFAHNYVPTTWTDLIAVLAGREWQHDKPGIIISFDDGNLDNYTVALPLLEKYGLQGIFLIPSDWVLQSELTQYDYAVEHQISITPESSRAMDTETIRQLKQQGHKIVCHTATHHRFSTTDTEVILKAEIKDSKDYFEKLLGEPCDTFGWVGGETEVYQKNAYAQIRSAGYDYVISTIPGPNTTHTDPHMIKRTALNPDFSERLVRLLLLSWYDESYLAKEKAIIGQLGWDGRTNNLHS